MLVVQSPLVNKIRVWRTIYITFVFLTTNKECFCEIDVDGRVKGKGKNRYKKGVVNSHKTEG